MLGSHLIKSWSSTQSSVALSSGEAEFNGVVRGAGIGLGYQSLLHDLGIQVPLRIWTDSSAAMGICGRQGLGKLRHLDTHTLWVQQAVRSRRFELKKIDGKVNPADLLTKHSLTRERLMALTKLFECDYRGGRAASAPETRSTAGVKVTISRAAAICGVEEGGEASEPLMPHRVMRRDALDKAYPSLEVHADSLCSDLVDLDEDDLYRAGMEQADRITKQAEKHGRRRLQRD